MNGADQERNGANPSDDRELDDSEIIQGTVADATVNPLDDVTDQELQEIDDLVNQLLAGLGDEGSLFDEDLDEENYRALSPIDDSDSPAGWSPSTTPIFSQNQVLNDITLSANFDQSPEN